MLDGEFDLRKRSESIKIICGTDEAGRGPLAGPVAAGACILPDGYIPEGLDDSKKLTEKKREALYAQITENALAWGIGLASAAEIDEINIRIPACNAPRNRGDGCDTRSCPCGRIGKPRL